MPEDTDALTEREQALIDEVNNEWVEALARFIPSDRHAEFSERYGGKDIAEYLGGAIEMAGGTTKIVKVDDPPEPLTKERWDGMSRDERADAWHNRADDVRALAHPAPPKATLPAEGGLNQAAWDALDREQRAQLMRKRPGEVSKFLDGRARK